MRYTPAYFKLDALTSYLDSTASFPVSKKENEKLLKKLDKYDITNGDGKHAGVFVLVSDVREHVNGNSLRQIQAEIISYHLTVSEVTIKKIKAENDDQMKPGQRYKNFKDEVHEIVSLSKNFNMLTCKNVVTNEVVKFRFYNASGKYIKVGKGAVDLGNFIK